MRILLPILLLFMFLGCQKDELIEKQDGRNAQEEQNDSATFVPNFSAEDWEGSIDVGF